MQDIILNLFGLSERQKLKQFSSSNNTVRCFLKKFLKHFVTSCGNEKNTVWILCIQL